MGIRLTPRRHLRWEPGEDDDISADLAPFAHSFEVDWREALFTLAAEKVEAPGSPVVRFWRQLADRYLTQLCHLPDDTEIIEVETPSPADYAHWGVGCGKGRKTTLRANQRLLGHLYSPLIRRCPHPRGAVWARSSGETGKPARLRLAAASPSRAVFQ